MRRSVLVAMVAFAVPLLSGCRSSSSYLGNRWSDLVDTFDMDVGAGIGAQLHFGLSHTIQAGFGSYETERIGWRRGEAGVFRETRAEVGVGPVYLLEIDRRSGDEAILEHHWPRFGEPGYVELPFQWFSATEADREVLDFGAGIHLFVAGLRFHIRTLEIADLVAGLFTIDLKGDDLEPPTPENRLQWIAGLRSHDGNERARVVRKLRRLGGVYAGAAGYALSSRPDLWTEGQQRAVDTLVDLLQSDIAGQEPIAGKVTTPEHP